LAERRRNNGPVKATWSIVASVVAHVGILTGIGVIAYHSLHAREKREAESKTNPPMEVIAIELPAVAEGTLIADRDEIVEGTPPTKFGGSAVARVDTGVPGKGGEATGERATNLEAADEPLKLSPDLLSRLDRDQIQRLRTAQKRTTHEDRRATTNPMELTFLASGKGEQQERRPNAPVDPSRGSLHSSAPAVVGGHPGSAANDDVTEPGGTPGSSRPGQLFASPGVGLRNGKPGDEHRQGARITHARPAVVEGPVTIPAVAKARPNDNVDSEQEVATTVRSLVHASVAGGVTGDGRGGSAAPSPDPGAGGSAGRGSVARPMGSGDGEIIDWNTNDPMLLPYFRKVHAKVHPLWVNAFPKSAMLELKQGTVILEFTIALDGTAKVVWPPVRPSGIEEFDRNCADAIRRAAPFEPIPQSLRDQGRTQLRIRAPFVAKNPIVK